MDRDNLIATYKKARDRAMNSLKYDMRGEHSNAFQCVFWATADIGMWNRQHPEAPITKGDVPL